MDSRGIAHCCIRSSAGPSLLPMSGRVMLAVRPASRTCEVGVSRAVDQPHQHLLDAAWIPPPSPAIKRKG